MSEIFAPIAPILLDSRDTSALVRAIQSRIFLESNGLLNDFTPASPLSAISEGQALASAELLYYINSLPEAFTLQWLRQWGIQRKLGSRATVDVLIFKSLGFRKAVVIPARTRLLSSSGAVFMTTTEIIIDSDSDSAILPCVSEQWGSIYNVGEGQISSIEKKFAGVEYLTNPLPAQGGSDIETVEEMKLRAFQLLSKRTLVTAEDFENEVRSIVSDVDLVKVLTYEEKEQLEGDFSGNVVICAGSNTGSGLNDATIRELITTIRDKVTIGTNVSITAPDVIPLDLVLNVFYDPSTNTIGLDAMAAELFTELESTLSPVIGASISYDSCARKVLEFDFVQRINFLDIKVMKKTTVPSDDNICGSLEGEDVGGKCLYSYATVVNNLDVVYDAPTPISAFRLYNAELSFTSVNDFSSIVFSYNGLYKI